MLKEIQGWCPVELDPLVLRASKFDSLEMVKINKVRRTVAEHYGCQLFNGQCYRCNNQVDGCYGLVNSNDIDEEIDELVGAFEELAFVTEECWRVENGFAVAKDLRLKYGENKLAISWF